MPASESATVQSSTSTASRDREDANRFTDALLEELFFELLRAEKSLGIERNIETVSVFAPSILDDSEMGDEVDLYVEYDTHVELIEVASDSTSVIGIIRRLQGSFDAAKSLQERTDKIVKVLLACIWCPQEARTSYRARFPELKIVDAPVIASRLERLRIDIPRSWTSRDGLLDVVEQLRLAQRGGESEDPRKQSVFYERHFGSAPSSRKIDAWMARIEAGQAFDAAILSADIVSFSLLLHAVDQPDKLQSILADFCQTIRQVVFTYDGTFDKFLGDGFLAYWGVSPFDHGTEAREKMQRAMAAAARIVQISSYVLSDITDLADRAVDTGIRVGIGYGSVYLFNKRTVMDELLAYGDALNIAFRVQGAAHPNGISLTRRAWNALGRPASLVPYEHEAKHGEKYFAYRTPSGEGSAMLRELLYEYRRAMS